MNILGPRLRISLVNAFLEELVIICREIIIMVDKKITKKLVNNRDFLSSSSLNTISLIFTAYLPPPQPPPEPQPLFWAKIFLKERNNSFLVVLPSNLSPTLPL